jgi:7-cyano-7-deazaguanine synthase
VHGGDHYIYPDCRPAFIKAIDAMLCVATDGFAVPGFGVLAPFLNWTKADIAQEGTRLGVDFTKTWSCYKGGDIHCGACGTCFERREAFRDAGITDPTEYLATPDYEDPR